YKRRTQALRAAEQKGKPVYVLRRNTLAQIEQFIRAISRRNGSPRSEGNFARALREAEEAVARVSRGEHQVELNPQGAYIRRLQHKIADKYGLGSTSAGSDPSRHVVIFQRS
ncbi:MAG: R3H domain-containing nucleic acid-binding protein, partial [Dehalococcoidia bacterium]